MSISAVDEPSAPPAPCSKAAPELGQVVEVRGSTEAVTQVQQQGLPRSPADEAVAALDHAVTLQALDQDRLGEELTVVWEQELARCGAGLWLGGVS